jgi:deazaflavin-dependent oxidoreductase (nitroreductase family)
VDARIRAAIATQRTVEITTTGRRTGEPRRVSVWRHRVDGGIFISGVPGPRGWYANLTAHPRFTYHLTGDVEADLPARARAIAGVDERRAVFQEIIGGLGGEEGELERWIAESPLIEVEFEEA